MIFAQRDFRDGKVSSIAVLLGSFVVVLLVFGIALLVLQKWYASGYPVSPSVFWKQAQVLEPGMTKEEVMSAISVYTERKMEGKRLIYLLRPLPDRSFRPTLYINIDFDESGRLRRVITYDG